MKKILAILVITLLSNCSHFDYIGDKNTVPKNYKVYVRSVSVKIDKERIMPLTKRYDSENYLSLDEVENITKKGINSFLKERNIYAEKADETDVFECEVFINYVRKFFMFTDDKYAEMGLNGYKISIYKDGNLFATRSENKPYVVTRTNFLKVFSRVISQMFLEHDKDYEEEDILILSRKPSYSLDQIGD